MSKFCWFIVVGSIALAMVFASGCSSVAAVRTYHYDNLRTGWMGGEIGLKPSNVNASSLTVLTLQLDDANDQVDTQPLIIPNVQIAGGKHDVVYVATENNNVYAIDANTDTKLLKVNLGPPVPIPFCNNNGPTVGINGTPVVDGASKALYVIAYVLDGNPAVPAYYLHALDLRTLTDLVPPRRVEAVNGTFTFNATYQRQRPGLLLANGNIYAGFGSFCDPKGPNSRGWVLGWQAGSLTPLPGNNLNNSQSTEQDNQYLSSVWESGYGIASDPAGNIFFTTGNSDWAGNSTTSGSYDGCTNIQESVVKLPPTLVRKCADPASPSPFLFTPANVMALDLHDVDVGAAGVMVLPTQLGPIPHLLVSNAKDGSMFLLNRDNLGGFTPNNAGALGGVQTLGTGCGARTSGSACWCGPTYFNDGSPRIVTSGGTLELWNLQTSPSPALACVASGATLGTIQDPGFFTTVSSNGSRDAIIWAVSRPDTSNPPVVRLYAFNAKPSGNTLVSLLPGVIAGSWPNLNGNANIVPVVANGKVYVASYRELDIFGLGLANGQQVTTKMRTLPAPETLELFQPRDEHLVSGTVLKVDGAHLTIETRDHRNVDVDASRARDSFRYPVVTVGGSVTAAGAYDPSGVFRAERIMRSKSHPSTWPPDR